MITTVLTDEQVRERSVKEMLHIFNLMKSILKLNRWNEKFEFYIDQERDRFIGKYKI